MPHAPSSLKTFGFSGTGRGIMDVACVPIPVAYFLPPMLNSALLKDRSNRVSPVSWRAISRLEAGTFTAMAPDWAASSSPRDCAG